MPRPRANPIFELDGQWIAKDPGSKNLYRFWTEPGTGRTRRASLGTEDIGIARIRFAEAVLLARPKTIDAPLSEILVSYFEGRTDKLPSKSHARAAGRLLLQCWGSSIRLSQLTEAKQREFAELSVAKGHSLSYLSRNLSVLAAAVSYAKLPTEIFFGKAEILERWALQVKAPRKRFVPSDDELARFLSLDLPPAFFRWCIMAALTGGRPEAVLDLTPSARDREHGLIDLNPAGRAQNKKYRAVVREPKALTEWLDCWEADMREAKAKREMTEAPDISRDRYVEYASVESVQTAMERGRAKASLPKLSVYSFRHKVATVLKKARTPKDQIDMQLGHMRPEGYGEYSPDYLALVAKTLDSWWAKIARKAKKPLELPRKSRVRSSKSG